MPLPRRFSATLFALAVAACGAPPKAASVRAADAPRAPVAAMGEDAFADAIGELLVADVGSAARRDRLDAVLALQMSRAARRFANREDDTRCLAPVLGTLLLARTGELPPSLGADGPAALRGAARVLAARGDEGRARAVYEMLAQVGAEDDRAASRRHLDALDAWSRGGDATTEAVAMASRAQREAVLRFLHEPSAVAREQAVAATITWVGKALELQAALRSGRANPSRSERYDAFRALQGGATALVAIHLRDGDVDGALAALARANLREWVRPRALVAALEAARAHRTVDAWMEIPRVLVEARADDENDPGLDHDLADAATLGVVAEAYRFDPADPRPAFALADALTGLGMAEAAPRVVTRSVRAHSTTEVIGAALKLAMRALTIEAEADDAAAARRAFRASGPILEVADATRQSAPDASAAMVRSLAAEVELREGRLAEARQLFEAAARAEPSARSMLPLARIAMHDGDFSSARGWIDRAMATAQARQDPALAGELALFASDVAYAAGDGPQSQKRLAEALDESRRSPPATRGAARARIERLRARVFDRTSQPVEAKLAIERALDATPNDRDQIAQTLTTAAARALVRDDVVAAREALSRAVAADVPRDTLTYVALWAGALERIHKQASSGVASRVLAECAEGGGWSARVAAFGAGRIDASTLTRSASTPAQATEAAFYTALERRVAGDSKAFENGIAKVAASEGVELVEMEIARLWLRAAPESVPTPSRRP